MELWNEEELVKPEYNDVTLTGPSFTREGTPHDVTHAPYRVWAFFAEGGEGVGGTTNELRFEGGSEAGIKGGGDTFQMVDRG